MALTLHGYWRSGTSYRTRIALNLKGLEYAQVTHDLRKGEQKDAAYTALAPQGLVPALEIGNGIVLPQSVAILEWLEETHPEPPLLPRNANDRAIVRAMCAMIGSDVHPINNLRILKYLKNELGQEQAAIDAWARHWIAEGFAALDTMIARHGTGYAYGDTPTLVDCYLVPQVYSAERFGSDLAPYPDLMAAYERAAVHPAIAAAHPDRQPDADQ
ncbi:maleylacetoacetate isomerase [Croceicoccus bisphenolivorans]|uniref:maleylacetoacetate isomerase n=1 Tax=Croceicoccus bisphenolivorans TaxID=1783232 RepID=UPI00082EBB22